MNVKFHINIDNIKIFENMRKENNEIKMIDMCHEFIKMYGNCIKIINLDEDEDEIENEIKIENENEENENLEPQKLQIKGSDSINNEPKIITPKTSFISLKMEIDTVLMFKLLIVLMIVAIVMIIIFLLRIEFKPLINYRIPSDYTHFTIQPPVNNVKKFSIFNRYSDGSVKTLKNAIDSKINPPERKSIKQEIIEEVEPAMGESEVEKFKGECFSSNYEFGI